MAATINNDVGYAYATRVPKERFSSEVRMSRLIWCLLLLIPNFYVVEINQYLEIVYKDYLLNSSIFRHDTFEPMLASFWFGVVMTFWVIVDFYWPSTHVYRIMKSDDVSAWKGRESVFYREGAWYLLPWVFIDYFVPRRHTMLSVEAPTYYQILYEIVGCLFFYDLYFFIGHLILHKVSFLYRNVHAEHHHSKIIRATDTIRHTFIDGSLDVAFSVMAIRTMKAHSLSRALYNICAITLITEAHCGMNFPFMLHNVLPYGLFAGPIVHNFHHLYGNCNFQKYFTYLDYFAGTLKMK